MSHSSRSVVRFLAELDVFAAFYNHGVNRKLASDLLGEWLILDIVGVKPFGIFCWSAMDGLRIVWDKS